MVTTFTYKPSLVRIDARNLCVIVVNRPTNTQTHAARPPARCKHAGTRQTGPITIHCAAKLSAQCNYSVGWGLTAFSALQYAISCRKEY